MGALVALLIAIIILAILFVIVREVLGIIGAPPVFQKVALLVFLLILLLWLLNIIGLWGHPWIVIRN